MSFQIGGFDTLLHAACHAAAKPRGDSGLTFWDSHGQVLSQLHYRDVLSRAGQFAAALLQSCAAPPEPGRRVGIVAATDAHFLPAFLACQWLGLVPCTLPPPQPLQDANAYTLAVRDMLQAVSAQLLLAPDAVQPLLSALPMPVISFSPQPKAGEPPLPVPAMHPAQAHDLAYVQFSSGTTGTPKGIGISHRALMDSLDATLREGLGIQASDRAFSWLPYYHDMGLVGFVLAPLCAQVPVDYLQPTAFARRPWAWLSLMSRLGSSITYAPSFAWSHAAHAPADKLAGLNLTALRIAGVGGDMVHANDLHAFARALQPCGFNPNAFRPSYGKAEATLAITVSHGAFAQLSTQDPDNAEQHWICAGKPLSPWALRIVNPHGQVLPAQASGRLQIQGTPLASCEFQHGKAHPLPLHTGWHDTGDMGFLSPEGVLTITGRHAECIKIRGRNIWPHAIEQALAEACAIDVQRLLLIPGPGPAQLLLLLESQSQTDDLHALLNQHARQLTGAQVRCVPVARHTIRRTSSGKKIRHGLPWQLETP